jgi:hypothetical protein
MAKAAVNGENGGDPPAPIDRPICGIVMPISLIDGCSEAHWAEVLDIVRTAAENAGFDANLVSTADDVGIIQKRIIQNLYDNPIVVCDVSGRNPNVMFELGLRLAFDKPTIIIKDDRTSYAFDTSPIEHLEYPRDLRFARIVDFKEKLAEIIQATHKKATTDKSYTTFLKHFGEFKVARVETKEVSGQEYILEEMKTIKSMLRELSIRDRIAAHEEISRILAQEARMGIRKRAFQIEGLTPGKMDDVAKLLGQIPWVAGAELDQSGQHLFVYTETTGLSTMAMVRELSQIVKSVDPNAVVSPGPRSR